MPVPRKRLIDGFAGFQLANVEPHILPDLQRAVAALARTHEPKRFGLWRAIRRRLAIAGRESLLLRHDPDLQQVQWLCRRSIELAVLHAGAGAHVLELPRLDNPLPARAVAMRHCAGDDVGDDLHVAMRM